MVLEGIEKAERNVLPVLNNLLENREMQLDDGRFLMHPNRYDKLLKVCPMCDLVCILYIQAIGLHRHLHHVCNVHQRYKFHSV